MHHNVYWGYWTFLPLKILLECQLPVVWQEPLGHGAPRAAELPTKQPDGLSLVLTVIRYVPTSGQASLIWSVFYRGSFDLIIPCGVRFHLSIIYQYCI